LLSILSGLLTLLFLGGFSFAVIRFKKPKEALIPATQTEEKTGGTGGLEDPADRVDRGEKGAKAQAIVEEEGLKPPSYTAKIPETSERLVPPWVPGKAPDFQKPTAKFCPGCGAEVLPASLFCSRCGCKL